MKLLKLPGLIDCHVHLRDPGATQKEDFQTGSKAALAGGFTQILDMPNNPVPTTTLTSLSQKISLAKQKALCDIFFYLGADQDNSAEFAKCESLVKGLKIYMNSTTGPLLIEKQEVLEKIFQYWNKDKPILVHAEDETVNKVLDLVETFRKKVHFCHVSLQSELEAIIKAKKKNLPITCEATPHHLFLTEKDVKKLGPLALMKPILRTQKDQDFLWKNLNWIDCIGSDHAPHTIAEKNSDKPPFGVPGLETTLALLMSKISIADIKLRLYDNPKRIFNLETQENTYIEIDPKLDWEIKNENLYTKCGWSPFNGFKVKGKVINVVFKGKKIFENCKFTEVS